MNTKTTTLRGNYTTPTCTHSEYFAEGVLCSSFGGTIEGLGNSIEYNWGEEE